MRIRGNKASRNIPMPEVEIEVETESSRAKRAKRTKDVKRQARQEKAKDVINDTEAEERVIAPRGRRSARTKVESNEEILNSQITEQPLEEQVTESPNAFTFDEAGSEPKRKVRQRRTSRVATDVAMESEDVNEPVDLSNVEAILSTTSTRKKRSRRSAEDEDSTALKPSMKVQKDKEEKAANSDMFNFFSVDDEDEDDIVQEETVEEESFSFFNDIKGDEEFRMVLDSPETVNSNDNIGKFKDIEFPDIRKEEEEAETESVVEEVDIKSTETKSVEESSDVCEHSAVEMSCDDTVNSDVNNGTGLGTKTEPDKHDRALLSRLEELTDVYKTKDSGVYSDDITVKYYDDESTGIKIDSNGIISLPNAFVYINGVKMAWDHVNETRVSMKDVIELDLGIGLTIPEGYELQIAGSKDLESKYGLKILEHSTRIVRQAALFPIVVRLAAVKDLAYIQKYRSIIKARLVAV